MSFEIITRGGISLDRLQTLVLLAEKGSLAVAAGQDPVRQSQFSRQISELSRCFGCKLTAQRGRTLALTPDGHRLANLAREHLQALDRFASDVAGKELTARIGAGDSIINWLLIPNEPDDELIRRVHWHYFNLQAEDIKERLLDQRLDFGLIRDIDSRSRLKTQKLGQIENSLFVPTRLLKDTSHCTPSNIVPLVPLALLDGYSTIRAAIEETCRKQDCIPNIRYECTAATQIATLIASGRAAGPLPAMASPRSAVWRTGSLICSGLRTSQGLFLHYIFNSQWFRG